MIENVWFSRFFYTYKGFIDTHWVFVCFKTTWKHFALHFLFSWSHDCADYARETALRMHAWHCLLCGVRLYGLRQQAAHLQNYNLDADDPSRCDNLQSHHARSVTNVIYEPDFGNVGDEIRATNVARISLLTRRCPSRCSGHKYMSVPIRRTLHAEVDDAPLDFCHVQSEWDRLKKTLIPAHSKPSHTSVFN